MPRDPRPVPMILLAETLGLLTLALWWLTLVPEQRLAMLRLLWWHEQMAVPPPSGLLDQVSWLWEHRLRMATGMVGLVSVAAVLGLAEGIAWRQRDLMGGFRLSLWTSGVVGLALVPGVLLAVLLLPWSLDLRLVGGGATLWVVLVGFLLAAGRPWVS